MKVVSVLGGRPHLIKAESFSRAFLGSPEIVHHTIECWLGNLNDYPRGGYDDFELPMPFREIKLPDVSKLQERLYDALMKDRPDAAVLYGDLPTTGVAAAACHEAAIPFVHLEAGYRSGDLQDPEESVRINVSHQARLCIAFSDNMRRNLLNEDLDKSSIAMFGNPALQTLNRRIQSMEAGPVSPIQGMGLVTFHHDENMYNPGRLSRILQELRKLADFYSLQIILYRQTEARLREAGLMGQMRRLADHGNVNILRTMTYDRYVCELLRASFVVTDSSTLQDECAFLDKPCFVLRRATPRQGDTGKWTQLIPDPDKVDLVQEVSTATHASPDNRLAVELLGTPYDRRLVGWLESRF